LIVAEFRVENRSSAAHISQMTQDARTPLLEVVVMKRTPHSWEWQVRAGDEILVVGFESTLIAARFAGNDARFLSLAKGWNR